MKDNYETCLVVGNKVVLFPYRPEHVPQYHEWMKDPALLEATDSEPLSFEEEIEMQQSWKNDSKKCTFIVHSAKLCQEQIERLQQQQQQVLEEDDNNNHQKRTDDTTTTISPSAVATAPASVSTLRLEEMKSLNVTDHLNSMIGDVNLFLSEIDDDDNDDTNNNNKDYQNSSSAATTTKRQTRRRVQAEIDIMIAEKEFQRQGLGKAATCAMLLYGAIQLGVERFFCKINEDNTSSIGLFQSIGFVQCDYAECFKQIELELYVVVVNVDDTTKCLDDFKTMLEPFGLYKSIPCPDITPI